MEISHAPGPATGAQGPGIIPAVERLGRLVAGMPEGMPVDQVLLRTALGAALTADLMGRWEVSATRKSDGAMAYEAARQASTPGTALVHLERAIKADAGYAVLAIDAPEFSALREPVANMIARLTVAARVEAQAAIAEAKQANGAESIDRGLDRSETRAIVYAAEARYQLHTYPSYVEATIAARLASLVSLERAKSKVLPKDLPVARFLRGMERLGGMGTWAADEARRLWERFPLLAILLGWFGAGAVFGLLTRLFGLWPGDRWILGFWGVGLLAMVVLGFIRSLRR